MKLEESRCKMAKKDRENKNSHNFSKDEKVNFILKLVAVILFALGVAIFFYPFVVDSLNNYIDQVRMTQFQKELAKENAQKQEQRQERLAQEKKNNQQMPEGVMVPEMGLVEDPFATAMSGQSKENQAYYAKHTVGAIYIPKIQVSLPLFDETNDLLLDKGATILQGTLFPIGGQGTHSVITGHTGLPDKQLFTGLTSLAIGDRFYLEVLGEKLAYELIEKQVVEPDELDSLVIRPEEDLVTLLTCTPYMINSHRLLWTGSRIDYVEEEAQQAIDDTVTHHRRRFEGYLIVSLLGAGLLLYWLYRKIVQIRSRKRRYEVTFRLVDSNGEALSQIPVELLDSRSRPLEHFPVAWMTTSDADGFVTFHNLPGNRYKVAVGGADFNSLIISGKVGRVKDSQLKLRGRGLRKKKGSKGLYLLTLPPAR